MNVRLYLRSSATVSWRLSLAIIYTSVKNHLVDHGLIQVQQVAPRALTNAELQVLLRHVGQKWSGEVVGAFEKKRKINGKDFQELQDNGFSFFMEEKPAFMEALKYAWRRAQEYIQSSAMHSLKLDAAEKVHSRRQSPSTLFTHSQMFEDVYTCTRTHAHACIYNYIIHKIHVYKLRSLEGT